MTGFAAMLAILTAVALAAAAMSMFAVFCARTTANASHDRAEGTRLQAAASLASMQQTVETLAEQIQEVRQQPAVAMNPGVPKPGLNLNKRSQALRMHRRGDPAPQIASTLGVPRQEIELLLKVHRIVVSNV